MKTPEMTPQVQSAPVFVPESMTTPPTKPVLIIRNAAAMPTARSRRAAAPARVATAMSSITSSGTVTVQSK